MKTCQKNKIFTDSSMKKFTRYKKANRLFADNTKSTKRIVCQKNTQICDVITSTLLAQTDLPNMYGVGYIRPGIASLIDGY